MIRLVDLKRNDVDGSLAYYRQCVDSGTWSADKAQSVATLHDDPDVFYRAVTPLVGRRDSARRYDLAPAIGKGGKGYNPYRSGGKFASGPHKERPKGPGRAPGAIAPKRPTAKSTVARPKREKFDESGHRSLIALHRDTEAHHRGESIRIAGEMKALKEKARATAPRSAERKELRAQHSDLAYSRGMHKELATDARQQRIQATRDLADAKRVHAAKQSQLNGAIPSASKVAAIAANDPNRIAIAKDAVVAPADPTGKLHSRQFSQEAQAAIRDHHNAVLATYGLHNHDAGRSAAKIVEIRTDHGMGAGEGMSSASAGLHWGKSGRIALGTEQASLLNQHAMMDATDLKQLGKQNTKGDAHAQNMLDAYRVSTHESIHGHGPEMSEGKANVMMEEMTTEAVARKVTGDVHGLHVQDVGGAYDEYIGGTAKHMSELSGRSVRDANAALANAAIWHKRRSETDLHPDIAMHDFAKQALAGLGVHDPSVHNELYNRMQRIAQEDGS